MVARPPIPLDTITPTRFGSISLPRRSFGSPAVAMASSEAAIAYWQKRSRRFASFGFMYPLKSKSLTSPAICVRYSEASNRVIFPIPHRPLIKASQKSGTLLPTHEITPYPVTTTRLLIHIVLATPSAHRGIWPPDVLNRKQDHLAYGLRKVARFSSACALSYAPARPFQLRNRAGKEDLLLALAFDVLDRIADGGQLLGVFIRNLGAEFFFQRHHELDLIEGVGAEIFDELSLPA